MSGGASGAPEVISLNVKEGHQTFKWLAQVVQARCTVTAASSGARLVSSIANSKNELVNPRDMIAEHAEADGNCKVTATLVQSFPSDVWGNPVYEDWLAAANLRSELGMQWSSEMNAWRERLQASVVDSAGRPVITSGGATSSAAPAMSPVPGGTGTARAAGNFLIQIGDEPDPESAFELDWSQMRWQWHEQHSEVAALRAVLRSNYDLVINLFRHYCGSGYVGQRYGMSMAEFAHLLHALNIVNLTTPSGDSTADSYFDRVVPGGGGGGGEGRLMSRPQLAQALAVVAFALNSGDPGSSTSNGESLQAFLSGPCSEYWQQVLGTKYTRYSTSDVVLPQALGDYWQLVKQAFLSFSTHDVERGPELALGDYMQLLVTSTLVFKDQQDEMISSFLHAQKSLASSSTARERELPSLVFAEFLEAVSHLAIRVIDTNAALGPGKRVRMALSMVCELQNHPQRRKK